MENEGKIFKHKFKKLKMVYQINCAHQIKKAENNQKLDKENTLETIT
jgi:RNA-splicing ligase RtcB